MVSTVLEVAGAACLLAGAFLLAGLGGLLLAGSAAMFAASYVLTRRGSA